MFTETTLNALAPDFKLKPQLGNIYHVAMQQSVQMTGLKDAAGNPLSTTIWGYSDNGKQVPHLLAVAHDGLVIVMPMTIASKRVLYGITIML